MNSSERTSSSVRLSPGLEHGREIAYRSDLRRTGIDDRKHALKDLGGVVGVDHEEEIVTRWIHPSAHHLIDVFGQGVHHRAESDRHGGIVFSRARVLVMVVSDMEEHGPPAFSLMKVLFTQTYRFQHATGEADKPPNGFRSQGEVEEKSEDVGVEKIYGHDG